MAVAFDEMNGPGGDVRLAYLELSRWLKETPTTVVRSSNASRLGITNIQRAFLMDCPRFLVTSGVLQVVPI